MILYASCLLLFALAGLFLFQGGIAAGIIQILLALGILFCGIFGKKKLQDRICNLIYIACSLGFVLCVVFSGVRSSSGGRASYEAGLQNVESKTAKGKTLEAEEELKELETTYGTSDETRILRAELAMAEDPSQVEQALSGFTNQNDEEYLLLQTEAYEAMAKEGDEWNRENLYQRATDFCSKGAMNHPECFELNYKAGALQLSLGNLSQAEYFLTQALLYAPEEEPYTPYLLALAYYDHGNEEYAYAMMHLAEERGIMKEKIDKEHPIFTWYEMVEADLKEVEG